MSNKHSIARFLSLSIALLSFGFALAHAEGTRSWEQSRFEELTKGTARGVAIRSNGGLELAPAFKALCTTPSTYIWALASDSAGNVYAAAGSPARVYRITPDGQATTIFEPQELQVQALVVDNKGVLYAGTAPDGKVYRIAIVPPPKTSDKTKAEPAAPPQWSASVYFDPKTKYIWDMLLDNGGNLFVATGDHGEIYRIAANGTGSLFFKSDEVHIRRIALDPNGSLIAGSDGSGLVYRISPSGEGFVLYSAPKKEITALAIDKSGNIYAAAAGERRPGTTQPPMTVTSVAPLVPPAPSATQSNIPVGSATPSVGAIPFPAPGLGATAGSEIYRIAPDGSPTRIWTSREDLVYALSFDQAGRLIVGSGNRGHIFLIKGEDDFIDLAKASATQVTAFTKAPGGLYASTSNLGKLFLLGSEPEKEGTYESDVFDTKIFSRFGRADLRGAGTVALFARSGNVDNPDRNWSPWVPVKTTDGGDIGVPSARFVQWKAVLLNGPVAPRVDSVLLYYLPKNVAPDIDDINVAAGIHYQTPLRPAATDSTSSSNSGPQRPDNPIPSIRDRDSIGVKWNAHDDNDDQMVYSLFYRGENDTRWLLLKDEVYDKAYSFDASLLPDGAYFVKVIASDAPSHSPGESLTTEKESARFEVDTTPPQISGLSASVEEEKVHVRFRAVDGYSPIKRAEYSVDAGDWQYLEPTGQLSDSPAEDYDFNVSLSNPSAQTPQPAKGPAATERPTTKKSKTAPSVPAAPMEHVVVVRVYDRFDNMSSAKTVIRGQSASASTDSANR